MTQTIRVAAGSQANLHDPVLINTGPTSWMDSASCRDEQGRRDADNTDDAKSARWFARHYCDTCPVAAECLAWGIRVKATAGVFGGRLFNVHGVPNQRWTDHPIDDRDSA